VALDLRLQPHKSVKNIRRFNKLLSLIDHELRNAGIADFQVDIWEADRPKSALKRLLTLERGDAHQPAY
jgi:hypothetical protein